MKKEKAEQKETKQAKIKLDYNTESMKKVLRVLGQIKDEVIMELKTTGIYLNVMNYSASAFIRIEIPKEYFSKYECDSDMKVAVSLEKLNNRLKAFSYEFVMLITEQTIKICDDRKEFTIGCYETDKDIEAYPMLACELKRTFKFNSGLDKDLRNLNMVGDVAEFKTKEAELVLQVVSDNKTEKAEIKPSIMGGKETIQGHTKFENVSSKYELELMRQVLKFGDLNTIKFGDNTPCLMEFNLGTIKLETILAPRVEQVMDDNFYDEEYEEEAEMEEVEQ